MDYIDSILKYEKNPNEDYYTILGCDELSTEEQIMSEYRLRAKQFHPDKTPDCPEAAEKFLLLQTAKEILCNAALRQEYDRWRHSGICMSFKDWKARADSGHVSMHWAQAKKKEPMLEDAKSQGKSDQLWSGAMQASVMTRDDLLRKFRNYEI